MLRYIRIQLHILNIYRIKSYQFHFPQNPIPVYLSIFRMSMIPFMGIVLITIINAYSNKMRLTRFHEICQFVIVGNTDIVYFTDFLCVYINRTQPVYAFERYKNTFAFPLFWNSYFTLIPSRPHILIHTSQTVNVTIKRFITNFIVIRNPW